LTTIVVTLPLPTVPVPALTAQLCGGFSVSNVTAKGLPLARLVGKEKAPLELSVKSSPPLSCNVIEEPDARPMSVPPTVNETVVQVTCTFVTLALSAVPAPMLTTQLWAGALGSARTVTS